MSHATTEAIWRWEEGADGIRTLWFDQPGRSQNVLDDAALDELEARLVEVENDGSVRGLVIRSAKPAGFCAGADLKTILSLQHAGGGRGIRASRPGGTRSSVRPGGTDSRRHPWCMPGWGARAGARVPAAGGPGLGRSDPGRDARGAFRLDSGLGGDHADSAHRRPRRRLESPDHGPDDRLPPGPVPRHRRPARLRRRLDRIARLALVRSRDRTDLAERSLGGGLEPRPGNGSTSSRASTRRPSSRSSRSSRSTSPMVARPPAKRPSKPWPSWPCRTSSAITWPRSSSAATDPAGVESPRLGRSHRPRLSCGRCRSALPRPSCSRAGRAGSGRGPGLPLRH